MKRIQSSNNLLAGAALAGLLSGGFLSQAQAGSAPLKASAGLLAAEKVGETHDCKGHNSCKAKGGCKSGDNGCAGKNSCKGKGGCAMKDGKPKGGKA